MGASAISICSNALLMLGAKPINAFEEDSDHALLCFNVYPMMRDWLLRRHPWNVTLQSVALAPSSTGPVMDFDLRFPLPGNCLRVLRVGRHGERPRYRVEGRSILCNENPLYLLYQRDLSEGDWDSSLVHLAALAMKTAIAYAVTKSSAVAESARDEFRLALGSAMAVDGQEDEPQTLGDFPLLLAGYTESSFPFER